MRGEIYLWIFIAVLHTPLVLIPPLFFSFRNRESLFSPVLLSLNSAALVMMIYSEIGRAVWVNSVGLWFDLIFVRTILTFVWQSLFLIVVWLYAGFKKTEAQMDLVGRTKDRYSSSQSIGSWIRIWNILLSAKLATIWMTSMLLCCSIIPLFAIMKSHDLALLATAIAVVDDINALESTIPEWRYAGMCQALFPLVAISLLHWKLWNTKDTFRIRRTLRIYAVEMVAGVIAHAVSLRRMGSNFNHGASSLIMIVVCDIVIITVMTKWLFDISQINYGLLKALFNLFLRPHSYRSGFSAEQQLEHFEGYLKTERGFQDFKSHLEKEFAVENLLFWHDVNGFKKQFSNAQGRVSIEITKHAYSIYCKYLSPAAPLEVNLPSELLKRYRLEIFIKDREPPDDKISGAMFDDAVYHTMRLMQYNSMDRYLRSEPASWADYLASVNEPRGSESISLIMNLKCWASNPTDDRPAAPSKKILMQKGSMIN